MLISLVLEKTLKLAALRVGHNVTDVSSWGGQGRYAKGLEMVSRDIESVLEKHATTHISMTEFEFKTLVHGIKYIAREAPREEERETQQKKLLQEKPSTKSH